MAATTARSRRRAGLWLVLPWLVLVASIGATLAVSSHWGSSLDRAHAARKEASVDDILGSLEAEVEEYDALLRSVGLVFQDGAVSGRRFSGAFATADLGRRYPGVAAVTWTVPVRDDEVASFAKGTRALGAPDFAIRTDFVIGFKAVPHQPGTERYVIQWAEPPLSSDAIQGLDLGASNELRRTLEEARSAGLPLSTPRFEIPAEAAFLGPPGTGAFFVFHPVFDDYESLVRPEERAETLRGWVGTYLAAQTFLDRTLASQPARVDVYEGTELVGGNARPDERRQETRVAPAREMVAFGRRWSVVPRFVPGAVRPSAEQGPQVVRAVGLGLSVALFGALWLLGRSRSRALDSAESATRDLLSTAARFRSVVQHASDLIWIERGDGRLDYVSPSAERLLGVAPATLEAEGIQGRVHPDDRATAAIELARRRESNVDLGRFELRLRHRDGSWRSFSLVSANLTEDDHVRGIVYSGHDITERRAFEARLAHQASHDPLTGLPNRTVLVDALQRALARAERDPAARMAVMFVDLDGFKVINDSLGHEAGDDLVRSVAARLRATLRPSDLVTRFGGDEFVLLCEPVTDVTDAVHIAERVLAGLRPPHVIRAGEVSATASIGIALADGAADVESLLRNADVAMYRAKERGRNRQELFDETLRDRVVARQRLEHDLRRAVAGHELTVHFQPIVGLDDGRIVGVEALARWPSDVGFVPPSEFMPVAEEIGLIGELGEQILDASLAAVAGWDRAGIAPDLELSVNVSPHQLFEADFVDRVAALLARHHVAAGRLWLEITENSSLGPDVIDAIGRLKAVGIRLTLDDFGTGYSSLLQLKRLPLDGLKIDRTFVAELGHGDRFVSAVMTLAHTQGLTVVAEGVESPEQAELLRRLGCPHAQGWYYSRPLPAANVAALLRGVRLGAVEMAGQSLGGAGPAGG